MAKELPYFKFEPNQWENGNIQICSREDKGLFLDLCSMYWSRLGDVPLKLAVQKLCGGNASAFDSLIKEEIFIVEDGLICIDFLNEQLSEFENTSKQNSKNAKERWLKHRKQKEESERNASASIPQYESDAIREEESREEKFIYTEKEFLEDWTQCRKTFLNVPTNFKSIKTCDLPKFNKAVKDYSKDQIREAMRGLFMQEVISFSSMTLQPSHFLKNVDKYYNAFISKDKKLYGSKPIQQ